MTNKILKNITTATIIAITLFSTITTKAENILTLPINNQTTPYIADTTFVKTSNQFKIKFIKIDLNDYYGSGTIVPQGFLADSGTLSQEGVITTSHIFQDERIKSYLKNSEVYNMSGDQTLNCKYSFGETLEYAIFVPIKVINELQQLGLISTTTILEYSTNQKINTAQPDSNTNTSIIGAKSSLIDLGISQVQSGDSGAMIFQNVNNNFNMIGVQFGYSKNTTNPYTIFWKLLAKDGKINAKVNWLNNKQNTIEWQDGKFIPKNCTSTTHTNEQPIKEQTAIIKPKNQFLKMIRL
jgi:hypothetical protein